MPRRFDPPRIPSRAPLVRPLHPLKAQVWRRRRIWRRWAVGRFALCRPNGCVLRMPERITIEVMAAARAAGEPPSETSSASARPDVYRRLQVEWLAVAMPEAVLPHEQTSRKEMWDKCKARYWRAIKAAAERELVHIDLRPACRPWVPAASVGAKRRRPDEAEKEWYMVRRGLLVSDRWRVEKCPEIEALNVFEPAMTPTGMHACRRVEAKLEAGALEPGDDESQLVVDHVRYSFGAGGPASVQNKRREKTMKREKDCLRRLSTARQRRLFPPPKGRGEGGGGAQEEGSE
eukprot:scaffold36793_cov57-Phaeocystis_antarctica.AAC.2